MEKYVAPINDILKKIKKINNEFIKNLKKRLEKYDEYNQLSKKKKIPWFDLKYSSDKTYGDLLDLTILSPPKNALLKMKDVKKLANMRKNKVYDDFIYVVEPQVYQKVTKLTPKSFMFESSNEFGYFTTGKSGIAHSGDGGDHGDKWWLVNQSLLKYLTKKYSNIEKQMETLKLSL